MEKITTAAAKSLANITAVRLTGLTAVNLQTLAQIANDSYSVLKTVGVDSLVIDGQCAELDVLFNQAMERLEDALLSIVSMNAHFVRSAEIRDNGYGEKTVIVTLHRD